MSCEYCGDGECGCKKPLVVEKAHVAKEKKTKEVK